MSPKQHVLQTKTADLDVFFGWILYEFYHGEKNPHENSPFGRNMCFGTFFQKPPKVGKSKVHLNQRIEKRHGKLTTEAAGEDFMAQLGMALGGGLALGRNRQAGRPVVSREFAAGRERGDVDLWIFGGLLLCQILLPPSKYIN